MKKGIQDVPFCSAVISGASCKILKSFKDDQIRSNRALKEHMEKLSYVNKIDMK